MTEKTKRKGNPRRRLLVKILVMIAIVATAIYGTWVVLQSTSAQIIFIAPDDNGHNQLWLAEIDNPEHLRQVSHIEPDMMMVEVQSATEDDTIVYEVFSRESFIYELHLYQPHTGQTKQLIEGKTLEWSLHPDGTRIVYSIGDDDYVGYLILDIASGKTQQIENVLPEDNWYGWSGDGQYLISFSRDQFPYRRSIHLRDSAQIDVVETQQLPNGCVLFAHDLSWCVVHINDNGSSRIRVHHLPSGIQAIMPQNNNTQNDRNLQIMAWHPDNEQLLITATFSDPETREFLSREIRLYNIEELSYQTLVTSTIEYGYSWFSFSGDGSKLLYLRDTRPVTGASQLVIYDFETGEEMPLPLSGSYPQWVNGGQ